MTEDELIREIRLKRQLSELDGTPAPGHDPSDGMETIDELKGFVRFLYATIQEKDQEILHLRADLSEIKDELKAANRRADEEAEARKKLFERLERFMDDQKSSDEEKQRLLRKVETLENRLSLANQALYGGSKTCNDKYSGKKSEGINDGRDDFDGTMQSLPEGTPGPVGKTDAPEAGKSVQKKSEPDGCTDDAAQEQQGQPFCYHGPSRKGCSYVKEVIGEPIPHMCVVPEGCNIYM